MGWPDSEQAHPVQLPELLYSVDGVVGTPERLHEQSPQAHHGTLAFVLEMFCRQDPEPLALRVTTYRLRGVDTTPPLHLHSEEVPRMVYLSASIMSVLLLSRTA